MINIATKKDLIASVDWLQVRMFEMEFEDIARNVLGIPEEYFDFRKGQLKHYDYDCCYCFGDIRIYDYLEKVHTDKMIVLDGSACEFFREVWLKQKKLSFETFMKNLLVFEETMTVTRLDVAIDDFNPTPFFTPTQLTKICEKKQFVYGRSTFYMPYGNEQLGATLYLKPPDADDRLRFYDKQALSAKDQGLRKKDLPSQIRTEVQFRREKAHNFFLLYVNSDNSLLELFQGYLKEKVKFYSDKEFQVPLRKWKEFLGGVAAVNLPISKQKVSLFRKINWLEHGGGLAVYKAVNFLKEHDIFPKTIEEIDYEKAEYSPELSNELKKYVVMLERIDLIEEIEESTKKPQRKSAKILASNK